MLMLKKNNKSGFLLVELIVAIFIFTIVMVVAFGSVVTAIDANKKTQSLEAIMNNLNLALDDVTRALAVGTNYFGTVDFPTDTISFTSQDGETVTYQFHNLGSKGYLTRQIGPVGRTVRLTSYEIDLQQGSYFLISGIPSSATEQKQPSVQIFLRGIAQAGPRNVTNFTLQSLVSQRIPEFD